MPLRSGRGRACALLDDEVTVATGTTPTSEAEDAEDYLFEEPTNEEPDVPVVKIEPGEPQPAAVGEAPAQPAVVRPDVQAVIDLVGRLEERGLFVHAGAVPKIVDLEYTGQKKERSKSNVVWHHDNKNVDLYQFAFFGKVVDPTNGVNAKYLSWRLGPQNAFSMFHLDPTGKTTYDYKNNFSLKLILPEGESTCDPERKYSKTATVNFLRQVDLETQAHAAKACSAIVTEYNRLHKGTDVMFKDYVDIARSGDKVLQQGAISPPHTNIIRAFCNTPHFSTAVYTSKCPCSGSFRLRRRTQPYCGSWQGRFAKHR